DLSVDDILKIADKKLKPCEKHDIKSYFEEEPYEVCESYVEQKFPVSVPIFNLGYKEKAHYVSGKESAEIDIIMTILTSPSFELYNKLDEAKLINQSFDAEYFDGQGYNSVIFSSESRSPKQAADMIKNYIEKLKENGISEEDFEIAKKEVYGDLLSSLNNVEAIANAMVDAHFENHDIFKLIDDVADCTLDDVNSRLKNMFDKDNTTLSVILPDKEETNV
ncbi:MAG: insulinase family protein, partial [Ruminococcus sp.]|nr:insulinase family protein [Ruminococcus sp.]